MEEFSSQIGDFNIYVVKNKKLFIKAGENLLFKIEDGKVTINGDLEVSKSIKAGENIKAGKDVFISHDINLRNW